MTKTRTEKAIKRLRSEQIDADQAVALAEKMVTQSMQAVWDEWRTETHEFLVYVATEYPTLPARISDEIGSVTCIWTKLEEISGETQAKLYTSLLPYIFIDLPFGAGIIVVKDSTAGIKSSFASVVAKIYRVKPPTAPTDPLHYLEIFGELLGMLKDAFNSQLRQCFEELGKDEQNDWLRLRNLSLAQQEDIAAFAEIARICQSFRKASPTMQTIRETAEQRINADYSHIPWLEKLQD